MPSASTKPDNKASSEANSPMNQVIQVVDKKVRNLEKRKGKLDSYKAKHDGGGVLNQDQEEAIARYECVVQNLEFAKELHKQFLSINVDLEKIMRKQAKRDKLEKQAVEVKRMKELLQVQNMLDNLGVENVRNDFLTGKHGAVELSEANLDQLDELYKLISPTRDGEKSYMDQLTQASEHIVNFLEGKEKEVSGTTYKDLKEMVDKIIECGYFEKLPDHEAEVEEAEEKETEEKEDISEKQDYEKNEEACEEHEEIVETEAGVMPVEVPLSMAEPVEVPEPAMPEPTPIQNPVADYEDDSYFTPTQAPTQTPVAVPFARQRPFNEIVSSVQGTFNFLQDSHIEMDSPHHDPAIVAARPMGPSSLSQTESSLSGSGFTSSGLLGEDSISQQVLSSQKQQQSLSDSVGVDMSTTSTQAQNSSLAQQLDSASAYETDYAQNYSTQNLQNGSPIAFGADTSYGQSTHPGLDIDQSGGITSGTPDVPPAIPLPNQQMSGQSSLSQSMGGANESSQESQEKKPFSMNPNAAMFQSMYQPPNMNNSSSSHMSSNAGSTNSEDKYGQSSQQNDYNNSGYGGFGRNGNGPRGGQRGGSRGGRGGVSNGFSDRNNRGGAPFRGGRGGFSSNRGNGRGAFQGYPPRNDYRPDGYQGFSNGNGFPSFKRGNGPPRGGVRGGAMRGGAPRGSGMRGGNAGRGSFGSRPNNGNQAMQQAAA